MRRFRAGLTTSLPDGWLVRESIELAAPEHQSTVVAAAEFTPAGTTAAQFAETYGARLAEQLPGYEELLVEETVLPGGREALLRRLSWTPPDGDPITELHVYTVEGGRGIAIRASASEATFGTLEPQLRDILQSIRLGTPTPTAGIVRKDRSPRTRTYELLDAGHVASTPAQAFGLEQSGPSSTDPGHDGVWSEVRQAWVEAVENR